MQDHELNFSCLLVTYRNTKIPATETILFPKRLIKEHMCRVNGVELGHLAEKNNFMRMTTAVIRFGTGALIIICSCDRVCNILLSEQNTYLPTITRNNTCDLIHPK